mmetsp:Transcript_41591/g.114626  ORF Transcript_41591/g.114626 Transcript_41591/m.114626 type:complete len:239 (-) Transcript_41591:1827-2543(-)
MLGMHHSAFHTSHLVRSARMSSPIRLSPRRLHSHLTLLLHHLPLLARVLGAVPLRVLPSGHDHGHHLGAELWHRAHCDARILPSLRSIHHARRHGHGLSPTRLLLVTSMLLRDHRLLVEDHGLLLRRHISTVLRPLHRSRSGVHLRIHLRLLSPWGIGGGNHEALWHHLLRAAARPWLHLALWRAALGHLVRTLLLPWTGHRAACAGHQCGRGHGARSIGLPQRLVERRASRLRPIRR